MIETKSKNFCVRLGLTLAVLLTFAITACNAQHDKDDNSPATSSAPASDPLAEAHERGRKWAQDNNSTLVSDCLGLTDPDERYGCAKYVNSLPH